MVRSEPIVLLRALMPLPLVPVTVPVEVTDSAPVPLLSVNMPEYPPETAAAEMVMFVP